jgi:cysteine desulfurase/selenocysteine lyase
MSNAQSIGSLATLQKMNNNESQLNNRKNDLRVIDKNPDWQQIRADFPVLGQTLSEGRVLAYLDNAASSQMPLCTINEMANYASTMHSNVHRGAHTLSQRATDKFEKARELIAKFIGASSPQTCIFTKGATEAINLVAHSYGRTHLKRGDEIILTVMEHHANIVPWQQLAQERGVVIKVAGINDDGTINLEQYVSLFTKRTRLVGCTHVSNVLGTINPIKEIIDIAHGNKAVVLIDGSQAVAHLGINVLDLNADFYAFSGHKMYGPTGIGVLYGKMPLLQSMSPFMGGGDMIESVTFERSIFKPPPYRFEAGTPPIMSAIGLAKTIEYINKIDRNEIIKRDHELTNYLLRKLQDVPGIKIIGTAKERIGVCSFQLMGIDSYDVGTILDQCGVAVRVGQHCAGPLGQRLNYQSVVRASLAFYNTLEEIDQLYKGLMTAIEILS